MKPKVIIPTGLGINSQEELAYCFRELGGAQVDLVKWNDVIAEPSIMDDYQGAGLAGGFAMGDQLGAGQSLANRVRLLGFRDKLSEKLEDPNFPMYVVCNSLQLLAKLDLFPIPVGTGRNDSGQHETNYWDIGINSGNDSIWFNYLGNCKEPIFAPISHGEGRIYVPSESLAEVKQKGLIALTYEDGYIVEFLRSSKGDRYNPNGSIADIAGFGWDNNLVLFPHFERLHHDFQRPDRAEVKERKGTTSEVYEPTYRLFKAAVDFMREKGGK
jgi:phosphoribosylformylglycinamidine synthase